MKEYEYYNKIKDWDFNMINCVSEKITNWDMYEILNKNAKKTDKILDLGTGGGEKLLKKFPNVTETVGTDFSEEMIKTANENLKKSGRTNIKFEVMDNLKMTTPANYFDIVVARNTCIDAKQIYKTLKDGGLLLIHGVDKMDCWQLKRLFGFGQAFNDINPISMIDYENVLDAGFKNVELIPIYVKEFYKTKEDLLALLLKTPILKEFSEEEFSYDDSEYYEKESFFNMNLLGSYIKDNTTSKGILLRRRYYGIVAHK